MSDQANFHVRNLFRKDDINVIPEMPDGSKGEEVTIPPKDENKLPILDMDAALIIKCPKGKNTNLCFIKVKPDVDLVVSLLRSDTNWTLKIVPNNARNKTPTTVNVDVGEEGP
jgi:hypothetical protein